MDQRERRRSLSFRKVNILIFVALLLASVGFTDFILLSNWRASAEASATALAADANKEVFGHIDAFVDAPRQINDTNRRLLEQGIVDIGSQTAREKYFTNVLESLDMDIYSFSFGFEDGAYYGARRDSSGVIQIIRNDASTSGNSWHYSVNRDLSAGPLAMQTGAFDPRKQDWYLVAQRAGLPMFSPIYRHFVMNDLTVSAATPIFGASGQLKGVLGTHLTLSNINRFLERIAAEHQGSAVIVERIGGALVANSFGAPNFESINQSDIRRFTLAEIESQPLVDAYQRYMETQERQFSVQDGNGSLYIQMTEYRKDGLDWLMITANSPEVFMTGIRQSIQFALILTTLSILIAVTIYALITDRFLKPIGNLIAATERLTQGDLTQRVVVVRNDEIGKISHAFNKMADTLSKLVNHLEETVQARTTELEARNESLRQADRNKNDFINALSHELRNPLAAIVAGLAVLDMAREQKTMEKAKAIIQRQTAQLSRLVDDLLDITRITHNKLALKKECIDISELATHALDDQRALFESKGIQLVADIRDKNLYVVGDPVRLTQIIGNLLHNSFKFTERGGTTRLTAARCGPDKVVISILDNGIGIQPELLDRLFKPFIQADNSIDRKLGGLGLGLSIVKAIVELHGGRVSATSAGLGHGAEFSFFLPLDRLDDKAAGLLAEPAS